jgi:phosphoribosylglycinamide formyltransferase-1
MTPLGGTFDVSKMAMGEPGLPGKFRWRKQEWTVVEVLEQWKAHGDCSHGSGERYLRKHGYRIRTAEGPIFKIYFQRQPGPGGSRVRWWIQRMEEVPGGLSLGVQRTVDP